MKILLYLVIIVLFLSACVSSTSQHFPKTNHIDTSDYRIIKQKFKLRYVDSAQNYLGGLYPNYPIADGIGDIIDGYHGPTNWLNGGLLPLYHKPIIKKGKNYVLINDTEELKKIYAPITSKEEALAYAILNTRFFAVVDKSFFKQKYKYNHGKPELSYSKEEHGYYMVHLFKYQVFGCKHPYSSVFLKVMPNGDITQLKIEEVFKDPSEDNLCVD